MRRFLLGCAVSGLSWICGADTASATPANIYGGGSLTPAFDYMVEMAAFTADPAHVDKWNFVPFYPVGSAAGQKALLENESTCLTNGFAACSPTGNTFTVHYGASDVPLTQDQYDEWLSSPNGQAQAANLLQIPSMGYSVAIPVTNADVTATGQLALTDTQLCGIFSGQIINWRDVSPALKPGNIKVVYSSIPTGPAYYLTNHLAAVCTTGYGGNSNFKPGFTASQKFSDVFANFPPKRGIFVAAQGSQGIADLMSGGTMKSAISYISQDYSSLYPLSNALNAQGKPYDLTIAALYNGTAAYLPTIADVNRALASADPAHSVDVVPPLNSTDGHNPLNWMPVIGVAQHGYPIVGYTVFLYPQCFQKATIFTANDAFLKAHQIHLPGPYLTAQTNNGFTPVVNTATSPYLMTIRNHIVGDKPDASGVMWHLNFNDAPTCKKLRGR